MTSKNIIILHHRNNYTQNFFQRKREVENFVYVFTGNYLSQKLKLSIDLLKILIIIYHNE